MYEVRLRKMEIIGHHVRREFMSEASLLRMRFLLVSSKSWWCGDIRARCRVREKKSLLIHFDPRQKLRESSFKPTYRQWTSTYSASSSFGHLPRLALH